MGRGFGLRPTRRGSIRLGKTPGSGAPTLAAPHVWLDRLLIAWAADPDGDPIQPVQHPPAR